MSSSSADPPEPLPPARGAPDDALVARAAAGERDALDELLRRHQDRIYLICRRLTGNDADARDATQEAMIAICRGIARFDRRSSFGTWAYRVTTNACLDELRRRNRRPVVSATDLERTLPSRRDHDDAVVARITLDEALAELPPEFRAALVLRELCELDYAEIGEVLAIPPGTVRSRIARGRAALLRALGNQEAPTERRTTQP